SISVGGARTAGRLSQLADRTEVIRKVSDAGQSFRHCARVPDSRLFESVQPLSSFDCQRVLECLPLTFIDVLARPTGGVIGAAPGILASGRAIQQFEAVS